MKLNKHQKDIVEKIKNREITDILSFVKYYNLGYEISSDEEFAKSHFEELYKDKTYICDASWVMGNRKYVVKDIDKETVEMKPRLRFNQSDVSFGLKKFPYVYNYFERVYVSEEINEIISFVALWNYLKEQALVVELPKTCSKEDMALFIRKKVKKTTHTIIEQTEKRMIPSDIDIYAEDLLDYKLFFDIENFEILIPFFEKKIYPAPELNTFIQKGFNTTEEVNNRNNFIIALAGVLIAIITSVSSIAMSIMDKGYYKELDAINSTFQKRLSAIETQLEELSNKEYSDSVISEKLDELIELLESQNNNLNN